jgi:cbb3-type cytochrome oxidase subunit 3
MNSLKRIWEELLYFFSDREDPDEPVYDPVHFAAMIVIVIFSIGVLFWLLWTLLVFEGGIFPKILPAVQVLFTKKTLTDFGWLGYPYELGVFEGFIANTIALVLTIALVVGIWWLFQAPGLKKRNE